MSLDDPKFSLIHTPAPLPEPRNYWNTSGKNREFFPTEPRPESIPTLTKHNKVLEDPKDPWWINSREHHYCFWTFIRSRSQPDGTMEPIPQAEITELFGCSSSKFHALMKEAMDLLICDENMKILHSLFELIEEESNGSEESIARKDEARDGEWEPE